MKKEQLKDGYSFPGFYPSSGIESFPGNSQGKVIALKRRQKKRYVAVAALPTGHFMTRKRNLSGIYLADLGISTSNLIFAGCFVRSVAA
jgi:hypothetical protein